MWHWEMIFLKSGIRIARALEAVDLSSEKAVDDLGQHANAESDTRLPLIYLLSAISFALREASLER